MSEQSNTYLQSKLKQLSKYRKVVIEDRFSPSFMKLCKSSNYNPTKKPHDQFYSTLHRRNITTEWEYEI